MKFRKIVLNFSFQNLNNILSVTSGSNRPEAHLKLSENWMKENTVPIQYICKSVSKGRVIPHFIHVKINITFFYFGLENTKKKIRLSGKTIETNSPKIRS